MAHVGSDTEHSDSNSSWQIALLSVGALLLVLLFDQTLLLDGSLRGHDWAVHYHYYDWIRISLTRYGTLPLFMADAWHTPNFLANAQSPVLGPLVWLLAVLPTDVYAKLLIVVYTAAGLLGMYWLLRDLRVAAPIALLGGLGFAFNGYFSAHIAVGHHWALGSYLLPALLCLFRRAAMGSYRAFWGAAVLDALAILEGQHHPFLWQNLFIGSYALLWGVQLRSSAPIRTFAFMAAVVAGLAAVKLLPMLAEFLDYAPTARIVGIPPGAILHSLTASVQYAGRESFGIPYQHGSGWWEYSFYVGTPLLLVLALGAGAGARRQWPILVTGALFCLLAIELSAWHPALDFWAWLQHLPVASSQRNPARLANLGLFAFLVVAAVGLQQVWEVARPHRVLLRALPVAFWVLVLWVATDLYREGRGWQRDAVGAPLASHSHRLVDPRVVGDAEGTVSLARFEPNLLVYRVETTRAARLVFPLRYERQRGQWKIEGYESEPVGEYLAVRLPPGKNEVVMRYRPRLLAAGVVLSSATILAAAAFHLRRRSARTRGDDEHLAGRDAKPQATERGER